VPLLKNGHHKSDQDRPNALATICALAYWYAAGSTHQTRKTTMSLNGKFGIVFGVANKRSIAWAIAQAWHKAGARLAFTYQGERLKENVEELAGTFGADTPILPCDVTKDDEIATVFKIIGEKFGKLNLLLHSVAFAPKDAL
jgi:enoyl-[acyl-carrier protein] reductase I